MHLNQFQPEVGLIHKPCYAVAAASTLGKSVASAAQQRLRVLLDRAKTVVRNPPWHRVLGRTTDDKAPTPVGQGIVIIPILHTRGSGNAKPSK